MGGKPVVTPANLDGRDYMQVKEKTEEGWLCKVA